MKRLFDLLEQINPYKILICAGNRNAPLLDTLKHWDCEYHWDERSAAFMAIGMMKVVKRPVVICTTSGTAVAECLPAMIEAFYSDEKLVVLSADRPSRLRNSRAPQAIDQTQIFSSFNACSYSGPVENVTIPQISFPMHLNVEIDDIETNYECVHEKIDFEEFKSLYKKSLAPMTVHSGGDVNILRDLQKSGSRIFIEASDNITQLSNEGHIRYEKTLINLLNEDKVDLIIKLGNTTPSTKAWRLLDTKFGHIPVVSIGSDFSGVGRALVLKNYDFNQLDHKERYEIEEASIDPLLVKYPKSEPAIINDIQNKISSDEIVFLGNSMPIRYWQLVSRFNHKIYYNRGANGIDGLLATAMGVAKESSKVVNLIIGDLSLLYDSNNLWSEKFPENLKVHCINNGGGQIFKRVKAPSELITPHRFSFENLPFVIEYIPDNNQTEKFWDDWNSL